MDEGRGTASRALRRFTLGSGPLKRTSDRLEFLARVLLVCTLTTAIPVALAVASVVHAEGLTEATAQDLERHQVDAELVADPAAAVSAEDPQASRALVVWPGPSGTEHSAVVDVPPGAEPGSTVPLWVDQDGDRTTRPLDGGDAMARAVGMAAVTGVWICVLAAGAYLGFCALLDRSRLRRWAADWAVTEPEWSRRVP